MAFRTGQARIVVASHDAQEASTDRTTRSAGDNPRFKDAHRKTRRARTGGFCVLEGVSADYISFVFFFFLAFVVDFAIAALGSAVAIGVVASDPDFAAAPPLVPPRT